MAIRSRKPTSPGRRFQTTSDFAEITKVTPEKALLSSLSKSGGRNVYGRKTSRHRGGGHKRAYRMVDFTRNKDGVTAKVAAIEYDPNRTCRIALLHYADGEKAYILAPKGLNVGDHVSSGHGSDIKPGNALPLRSFAMFWGRLIRIETPFEIYHEPEMKSLAELGDILFAPDEDEILIPYGRTPISAAGEIRLPLPGNLFARAINDVQGLRAIQDGAPMIITAQGARRPAAKKSRADRRIAVQPRGLR